MNVRALKAAARYLGCWFAMVFFVVLLTTIFSFLGTIICAVLAGMMLGAAKHQRWQAVPVAVVFPTVIFTMLRSTRAELLGRQVMVLSLLCFGAFWLTYLVTSLLLLFEAKNSLTQPARGPTPTQFKPPASLPVVPGSRPPGGLLARAPLSVADLQGQWHQPVATGNGHSRERRLEISGDLLKLSLLDSQGGTSALGETVLNLCDPGCPGSGRAADPSPESETRATGPDNSHNPPNSQS